MAHVVDYTEYEQLEKRVKQLEVELIFLKDILMGEKWLSRKQAMAALRCSENTLRRLANRAKLVYRYEGIKPFYEVDSIRNYLKSQKIDDTIADQRVLIAHRKS